MEIDYQPCDICQITSLAPWDRSVSPFCGICQDALREHDERAIINSIRWGDWQEAKMAEKACQFCGKRDETVRRKVCDFDFEIEKPPHQEETVCDDCEEKHRMDI